MLDNEITNSMISLKEGGMADVRSCSVTPSECSRRETVDKDGSDSDYESDHGEERYDQSGKVVNIQWIGPGRTIPILTFDTKGFFEDDPALKNSGVQNSVACKVTGDSQILREILTAHGFREVGIMHRRYNLAWIGRHTKPTYVKKMANCHIINHFPRTEELTRKDKLYKNVIKMQETKGKHHFDFVPVSFKLPSQYKSLRSHFKKEKGLYIVKPVSLSRGRGVYVIDNPKKINSVHVEGPGEIRHETRHKNIVSKYIPNPLIINGYKCDLRLYVAVTSFDPVVVYLYSEGLTRFATVKYNLTANYLNERCMHLTNYSVNMDNEKYIKNIDSSVENEGSKWSLGALLRYFKSQGKDTAAIMEKIEDVVVKTILSVEWKIGAACKQFMRHRHNCFELFGFDILLDDNYKPWLIEVNLSPSLGCDTPLDIKVKSNMLCDLLNLVGIRCYDPHMQNLGTVDRKTFMTVLRHRLKNSYGHYYYRTCRDACHRMWGMKHSRMRLRTMLQLEKNWPENDSVPEALRNKAMGFLATLTHSEVEIIQKVREENSRRYGWVRVFPTSDSWDKYHKFMDYPTTNNLILHQRLYPERHKLMTAGRSPLAGLVTPSPSVNELFFKVTGHKNKSQRISKAHIERLQRIQEYETPLSVSPPPNFRHRHANHDSGTQVNCNPFWNEEVGNPSCEKKKAFDNEKVPNGNGILLESNSSSGMSAGEPNVHADQATVTAAEKNDNLVDLLVKGYCLSHLQAREAFTAYLGKIKKMLIPDQIESLDKESEDAVCDLMKLVTTFLKQSVQYLVTQPQFDLSVEQTSPIDHRLFLAQNLDKFIQLYIQETDALNATGDQVGVDKSRAMAKDALLLDNNKLHQYIDKAGIKELEMLLLTYSKIHDPVSTFLGDLHQEIPEKNLS